MKPRRPRILVATSLATAGLSLAACSTTPAATPQSKTASAHSTVTAADTTPAATIPAATTGSADPCSLLTQADVDTAVGQPLGKGKSQAVLGMCQWSTSDFVADVDITVGDWVSIKGAATAGSHQPVSVPGVGDEALNLNGSNGSLLYVRKGSRGFLLSINGPKVDALPDHGLAEEKVLAAALLGRL